MCTPVCLIHTCWFSVHGLDYHSCSFFCYDSNTYVLTVDSTTEIVTAKYLKSVRLSMLSPITTSCFITFTSYSPLSSLSATLPMSPWNSGALVSLRERLKGCVWLDTKLIGKLEKAAGGFMDQTEVQKVKLLTGNRERVALVIDVLLAKGDKDFDTFCKLLQRNNCSDLANSLEDKASRFKAEVEKGMYVLL